MLQMRRATVLDLYWPVQVIENKTFVLVLDLLIKEKAMPSNEEYYFTGEKLSYNILTSQTCEIWVKASN